MKNKTSSWTAEPDFDAINRDSNLKKAKYNL